MKTFISTIKTKDKPLHIIICLALLIAILTQFSQRLPPTNKDILLSLTFLAILLYATWELTGQIKITITDEKLIIERRLLYLTFYRQKFNLSDISKIEIMTNVKASTYFSFGEIKFLGFEYTPEWLRKYDIDPVVIFIDHSKGIVKIGAGLQKFSGNEISQEIKKRQNKLFK